MSIYPIIDGITDQRTFLYVCIILFAILYFRHVEIKLNIFLALIIGLIVVWYMYDKNYIELDTEKREMEEELNNIIPHPKNFEGRNDIIDFFFSIQDLYYYNPLAYEEAIDNTDSFFELYRYVFLDVEQCDDYFTMASDKKRNALNALHSIVVNMPDNKMVMDKLDRAHKRLNTLLTAYENEMYEHCRDLLIRDGYNVYRRAINTGPLEANQYIDSNLYSYQLY